jgi:putative hemolysin
MIKKTIDVENIIKDKNPSLYRFLPSFIVRYLKRIVHEDEINSFLNRHGEEKDLAFVQSILDEFQPIVSIKGLENIPSEGGAILAANHPLGGLDALVLMNQLSQKRTDMKFMVNDILMNLKPLQGLFVPINKHGRNTGQMLEDMNNLYSSEQLILVFPAGLVSRKQEGIVKDLEWKKTFVSQAKKHQKTIIPVHISGELSPFFYKLSSFRKFLGIKANIEMLYLADEMYQQHGKNIKITIGKPILPDFFDKSKKDQVWASEIKEITYGKSTTTHH